MERFEFTYSPTTVEPPTGSQVRLDNTDLALVTKVWARITTAAGEDVYWLLRGLRPGDVLYLQDFDDHTRGASYTVIGSPVDKTGYIEVPVTAESVGTPMGTTGNQRLTLGTAKTTEVPEPGPGPPLGTVAYATTTELARVLELRAPTSQQTDAMERCLDTATAEVDWEVGHDTQYPAPFPPLAVEVTLERAVEHWHQSQTPWGVYQTAGVPMLVSRDSWRRHAYKLLPLKETFGVA